MTAKTFGLVALAVCVGSLAARAVAWGWEHAPGATVLVVAVAALLWTVPYYVRENRAAGKDHRRSSGGSGR